MSVGLLLITHNQVGDELLDTARNMLGICPLLTSTLPISSGDDPDQLRERAQACVRELDQGDGVLVLTDMYGSTPSNIAADLRRGDHAINVVAGLNLPMLVRVLNYPTLSLDQLTNKATSGGYDGILRCRQEDGHDPH